MPTVNFAGQHISKVYRQLDWDQYRVTHIMRFKDNQEVAWIDRYRIVFRLSEITDSHLQHIERWLLGRGMEDIPARKRAYDAGYYDIVRDELDRRGLALLPDHDFATAQHILKIEEPQIRINR